MRPELRGEIQGAKVVCLGCSTEITKVFKTAASSNWNLHVQRVHTEVAAAPLESQGTQRDSQNSTQPDVQSPEKGKPARRSSKTSKLHPAENGQAPKQRAQPAKAVRMHAAQKNVAHEVCNDICIIDGKRRAPAENGKAQKEGAQPAQQHAVQRDVTADANSETCSIVGNGRASFSQAPADSTMSLQCAPKEQGSFGSRNASSMPSRKPVSKESQASMQSNLESCLSSPAAAKKSSNADFKFSTKTTSGKT